MAQKPAKKSGRKGYSKGHGKKEGVSLPGVPRPVDVHVGARVRMRRTLMGLSQEKLGEAIGLTFQQIQKYERGSNRISASRLFQFSQILNVPVPFFFEDMTEEVKETGGRRTTTAGPTPNENDPLTRRETLELVRAYYGIGDPKSREAFRKLVESTAKPKA